MERTPVTSKTGLCGMAYDAATKTLELEFKSRKDGVPNGVYHYANFTQADWDAFSTVESKGSYFLRLIKPHFVCTKLEQEKKEDAETKAVQS
jgi:KTSC domain